MAEQQMLEQPVVVERVAGSTSGPSLWEVLWQRKSYVALGTVIGVVLGVLYWSMAPKTYESKAQVWVLKKQPDAPVATDAASMAASAYNAAEDFLTTHRTLITSAIIVGDAISKGHLSERSTVRNYSRPPRELAKALTVTRDRDKTAGAGLSTSQILNVSFKGGFADDCVPVLTAVLDSYRDFLDVRMQDSAKQTLELIEKAQEILGKDLELKEKARDDFLSKTPVLWKTQLGTTLNQERLANVDAQRTSLSMQIARLRETQAAVEKARKEGRSQAEILEIVNVTQSKQSPLMGSPLVSRMMGGMDPSAGGGGNLLSSTLEQELISLQLEIGKLKVDYGPNHSRVKALEDRTRTIRSVLAPSTTPEAKTVDQRDHETNAREHIVALKLGQLKQDLAEAERGLVSIDSLFKSELVEARKIFPFAAQEAAFTRAIERSQTLFDTISQRLRELNVVSSSRGFETHLITPPTDAEKIAPQGSIVLPLALFLGVLFGCGLAYLAELTDKSFRSPEDVRRRLGVQIMGVIPLLRAAKLKEITEGETPLDPSLISWHFPKSKEAESYRGVRTALYFSTRGQGRKLVQVTSPNQGDGKSTLAANLAVSIAQSNKTVLIVDGDLRRPHVGRLFGVSSPLGFSSVLTGQAQPDEAICPTAIPGLFALPAGPVPPNPAELLTSLRLREVLDWLRDRYDYVIVDSPPVLAVTDPGVVGPAVDGVIITLRMNKRSRIEAKRAKEILSNLGVNIFGVVVNALDQTKSYESYGGYYYGYGYYGHGYYEEYTSDEKYTSDERRKSPASSPRSLPEPAGGPTSAHEGNGTPVVGS